MQKERKGTGLLIAILLIIILILISLVGFFIYNDYYLKEDSNESNTEIIAEEELSLTDAKVIDIEKKIDGIFPYPMDWNAFYDKESISNNKMTEREKQFAVIYYLEKTNENIYGEINSDGVYELNTTTANLIISTFKNFFGNDQVLLVGTSYDSDSLLLYINNKYILPQYNGGWASGICIDYTEKALKTTNEIKIYKKVGYFFLASIFDKDYSTLTSDRNGKNIISKIEKNLLYTDSSIPKQIKNNSDKFDTYIITFKLDETGNYYFYSSEKA